MSTVEHAVEVPGVSLEQQPKTLVKLATALRLGCSLWYAN